MNSQRQLVIRVTLVACAVAVVDLLLRSLATATLASDQHVSLGAGGRVVAQQQPSGLVTPTTIGALGALILVLIVSHNGITRRTFWLPIGLLLGAGLATPIDLVGDGRITRWLDPPLWSALNMGDLALAVGLFGLIYALGETLGGGEPEPRGTTLG